MPIRIPALTIPSGSLTFTRVRPVSVSVTRTLKKRPLLRPGKGMVFLSSASFFLLVESSAFQELGAHFGSDLAILY
jgi:hypothetical protein